MTLCVCRTILDQLLKLEKTLQVALDVPKINRYALDHTTAYYGFASIRMLVPKIWR